ncbi:hypothetical protein [Microvirga sp. CF3016]|uniref:hypothetical protein n=1 Tax=Microvirga sp. CF3016 TaxID=3110181 RepID=UPI002E787E98|nr:hypothetical protein [Microvirga sp. CF3016]MEE1611123.1 hypothetical protein [Microvirga sp. CF3016]
MRVTTIALGAVLLLGATPAIAEGELYRCSARNVSAFADDGTLGQFNNDFWTKRWTDVLVDTATGLIRWSGQGVSAGSSAQWVVIQNGSSNGDFVASRQANLRSASTDVLRIRAWSIDPSVHSVRFIYFGLSMIVTGVCEPVQ